MSKILFKHSSCHIFLFLQLKIKGLPTFIEFTFLKHLLSTQHWTQSYLILLTIQLGIITPKLQEACLVQELWHPSKNEEHFDPNLGLYISGLFCLLIFKTYNSENKTKLIVSWCRWSFVALPHRRVCDQQCRILPWLTICAGGEGFQGP